MSTTNRLWQENWTQTRERFAAWWHGKGLLLSIEAPADQPHEPIAEPEKPALLEQTWLDPVYRVRKAEFDLSRTFFGGEAFPYFDAHLGPGNLATFLGSEPRFAEDTVWYEPCTDCLDGPLQFTPDNVWFQRQLVILQEGIRVSDGRFLVGMPDLIENMDTLASLRGSIPLMMDLINCPDVVAHKINEINHCYFDVFTRFYDVIRDEWDGNAFSAFKIWGPGKTAKLQCDASAMFSPQMFADLVVPALTEQCQWLDYSLYHLDGTQALKHLDQLLAIEPLNAIEWTPQAGIETGGSPRWYDLYRKILQAGKSVEAILVEPHEIIPLLDAVGPKGLLITATATSERQARDIVAQVERDYR